MSHGRWIAYKPETLPEFAPPNALFCRRETDSVDWYDYVKNPESFAADSVKFTAVKMDYGWIIGAANRDATMLHPAGQLVLEVIDYKGADPQEELENRLFDPETLRLGDRPPLPVFPDPLQPILDRLARIEAKLGLS